jgi:hypothetical protein
VECQVMVTPSTAAPSAFVTNASAADCAAGSATLRAMEIRIASAAAVSAKVGGISEGIREGNLRNLLTAATLR